MASTFETVFRWLVPSWLIEGEGDAVLRSLTRQIDENVARFREGLDARFPSRAINTSGALEQIGADRGIQRGRNETAAHYAQRLIAWRYPRGHRVRGSAYALLSQIYEYWGGVACQTVDANNTQFKRSADGAESVAYAHSWFWDGKDASLWARFWVVLDGSTFADAHPDLGDADLWGGALGTDGYTVGQTGVVFDDVQAMRRMLTGRAWRPAGTQPEWLVLTLDPLATLSPAIVPQPTWEWWSRTDGAGTKVKSRDTRFRYWSLDPEYNNVYAGFPDLFCLSMTLVDGSTYAGDPAEFAATITMPGGATYAGDPDNFAATIRLLDDGDPSP